MICVDASVAVKWFLREEARANQAMMMLRDCVEAREELIGPPLLYAEVTNIAYQQVRRGLNPPEWGREIVAAFIQLPVKIVAPFDLYTEALRLAAKFGLPATYDAQYVALAQYAECDLWTDDHGLIRAVQHELPFVRSLSEYDSAR